jgi:hypothetical protein
VVARSENSHARELHRIARLYSLWVFNFMIDVAGAVADDFVERPERYRDIPDELCDILSDFRSQLGSHPAWPDAGQRKTIFRALGDACLAGAPLREAALVYVETGSDFNRDLLADAFRDAANSFRMQISAVEGPGLETGCRQIGAMFDSAVQVFRSDALMRPFGLAAAPSGDDWPIGGGFTDKGAVHATQLIRALDGDTVAQALLGGPSREVPGAPKREPIRISMPQNKFILLQQAAWYGAVTISDVMADVGAAADDGADDLHALVGNAYKWTKALQRLIPDVVRVWKDPQYRMRLTDLEWGMVEPHPSGAPDFAAAAGRVGGLGFSTATVRGEVCCCTGDLPCPASSNCEISPGPSCINCGTIALVRCAASPI